MFHYEHRSHSLLPKRRFLQRLGHHAAVAIGLIVASLAVGTVGYHLFGGQAWIDAFLNSAMLLGGMGPIGEIRSDGGKIFAAFFALYAGLLLIAVTTIILAPVLHRILHRVHLEDPNEKEEE